MNEWFGEGETMKLTKINTVITLHRVWHLYT